MSALGIALYSRCEWPWLPLGWIALVPWLAALDRVGSVRSTLAVALLMAPALELAVVGWFAQAIAGYTGLSQGLAVLILVVCAPLFQPQIVTFAVARYLARAAAADARWLAAIVGAGVYVGTEWAVPKFLADTLGYGLYPSVWLRQGADVVGVSGLTFSLVLGNECVLALGLAMRARGKRFALRSVLAPAACLAAMLAVALGYGAARTRTLAAATTPGSGLTAGVVQANLSHYDDMRVAFGTYETVRRILDDHFALSSALLRRNAPDLLVWPETIYPTTFGNPKSEEGAAFDRAIAAFVAAAGVPLIFGSYDVDGADEFNAAVVLEPPRADDGGSEAAAGGQVVSAEAHGRAGEPNRRQTPGTGAPLAFDTYRKAALFPLTEHVPAMLDSHLLRDLLPWLGTWKAGAGAKVIPVVLADGRTVRVAPLICYDVLAPALVYSAARAGAELFVTLSNDSWFAVGKGPRLHLVGAIFRSIETRRPQVRATNTGISAAITATGEVIAMADVDERAMFAATIMPEATTTTILVAWGEWFGPTALLGSLVLLGLAACRRRPAAG